MRKYTSNRYQYLIVSQKINTYERSLKLDIIIEVFGAVGDFIDICAFDFSHLCVFLAPLGVIAEYEYGRGVALDVVEAFEQVDARVVVVGPVLHAHHVRHHLEPHVHPVQQPVELLRPLLGHTRTRQLDHLYAPFFFQSSHTNFFIFWIIINPNK